MLTDRSVVPREDSAGLLESSTGLLKCSRRTAEGKELLTNSDIRRWVLAAAGIGIVQFQAFGSTTDDGWFRLSVGAVSMTEIEEALPRLEDALRQLI